ncbi:MAG: hypothetical protein FJW20_04700 [Acidimicrobiia bacterium]|nr:hypothetical protein [Acidimicrobiia bacterium]
MSAATHPSANLSAAQLQVIAALASGSSVSAAAAQAGVHRSTIHNWLKSPSFSTEFDKSRQDYLDTLGDQLRDLSAKALDTIRQVLDNPDAPPAVRLRAALAVLNRPHFPNKDWHLPEKLHTPAEQHHHAEMDAMEADYRLLCLEDRVQAAAKRSPNPNAATVPRSAPCPCGSGLKFKRCCGVSAPPLLGAA